MNKLFFDIIKSGHHSEYIDNIVSFLIRENNFEDNIFFVVHYNFIKSFPHIYNKIKEKENIIFIEVKQAEYSYVNDCGMIKKSFRYFNLLDKYAKDYNIKEVFVLYFNSFQLSLGLRKTTYDIKGILFLQFYRMSKNSIKEKFRYYRKFLITKLYLRNKKIKSIFLLNDYKAVEFFNSSFKTQVFKVLKDPVSNYTPMKNFDIYSFYNIEKHKKIFLHFGSLSNRKGTLELIESIEFLSNEDVNNLVVLLAGRTHNQSFNEALSKKIDVVNNENGSLIIWDNSFVSNEQMKSLFDQCFSVVIPYKNVEASSGVLGNAIASNKVVITTGKGLLRELVEDYNAGLLIEDVVPHKIAKCIKKILNHRGVNETIDSKRYVLEHSVEVFSYTILSS